MGARICSGRPLRSLLLVLGLIVTGSAASCARVVDADEFQTLVRARGGGLAQGDVEDAVAEVEESLGGDGASLRQIVAVSREVVVVAVDPSSPTGLVRFTFSRERLSPPEAVKEGSPGQFVPRNVDVRTKERIDPVPIPRPRPGRTPGTTGPAGDGSFDPSDVAVSRLDELIDRSVEVAKVPDGAVNSIRIASSPSNPPTIAITVSAGPDDATVVFDAAGNLLAAP